MRKPTSIRSSTEVASDDSQWMERAIELAREGVGLAHPNPMVGAVVVKNGRAVGTGLHIYDERDHAEIAALRQAGKEARGATLYLNLEPCCHTGRTGPCTQTIIEAGVRRVVAAMEDPNLKVAGQGFAQLRNAGVQVTTGMGEEEAQRLNEDFARWIKTGLPFVTLKAGLTLDGQIAMRAGKETPITGEESREAVQRMRHAADGVLTGIGTILSDDPLLTDRTALRRRRKLLRAVADSRLRIPMKSKIVQSAEGDVVVFTAQRNDSPKARALRRAGVEVVRVRARGAHIDPGEVTRELGRRQILNLLLEAGAELNGAALTAGIVDKMVLFYAPKIMGTGGVPLARIPARLFPKARALSNLTLHGTGHDFAVEGYFHDVYRDHGTGRKN
ncbi:MAG TPA: bifunctional diaminohydroxyphosphoribosylaminopyrimidine deaminase/5-amino-6-(5-phosphoribosylamino)uracil reductase RibD [Candidatus Acidoferrales bacterium]|nr:bifunctional diaminohydroxyphosphoribosylaminopyrimidine deaminase/5-amino-6-(5-phosphoribosylamino)uracil reductase RibD [Candidatus Acidoferrales bacterium]